MHKITIKEVSLLRSGEVMEWVFKNCPSYDHGLPYSSDTNTYYYELYFNDQKDVEWFTLKWFDYIVPKFDNKPE